MISRPETQRSRGIQWTLALVLALNLCVAVAKLVAGTISGSLSMVADGFHSAMDTSSNGIGIVATAMAERPPDANHPYGHRRFETMASMAIGGLLLLAGWEVLTTAIGRLFSGEVVSVGPLSFLVMLCTMAVNAAVTVIEEVRGRRLKSDVLLAYAVETRTDFLVSLAVIIGLAGASLGLKWLDTAIALLIVLMIGRAAFGILRKTTLILTDAAAVDPEDIRRIVAALPGVDNVIRVRSRGPANSIYADIDVQVQPATTADRAQSIANEITHRIKDTFDGITEVQVHFAPHHDQPIDRTLVVRAAADALGLSVHEVTEILTSDGLTLEMHVEVSPALTLAAAHQQVTELENRVRAEVPDIRNVITHIEPASGQPGAVLQTTRAIGQRDQALAIARALYPDANWHDATIRPVMGGYAMTLHCWLPGTMSVQEAHTIAEQVETQIRAALPQIQRVTIHTEPPEEAARDPH
ncbi:MAG TPA: cation-efflux pump [Aggregatilineales bacterium]|nr:cation-efflux pump [Aggregatilineales bacterium]